MRVTGVLGIAHPRTPRPVADLNGYPNGFFFQQLGWIPLLWLKFEG